MTQGPTPPNGGYPAWMPQADPRLPLQPNLPATPTAIDDFRPPPSRLPWIVALVAIVLVGLLVWSLQGPLATRPKETPTPSTPAAVPTSTLPGAPFTTSAGSAGRWLIESATWDDTGVTVRLRLWLDTGQLSYQFETISNAAGTFGEQRATVASPSLRRGTLTAGQSATGNVAFDLPRGTATLLLETSTGDAIAALQINS